jgi:hypothetical protein
MLRLGFAVIFLSTLAFVSSAGHAQTAEQKAQALIEAYPDHLAAFDGANLIWKDGTAMPFSDGKRDKSPADLLNDPSVEDMFASRYGFGGSGLPAKPGSDPGRVRNDAFFQKMYGACERKSGSGCELSCASTQTLKTVPWVPELNGGAMKATTVNRVDLKLKAVSDDLQKLGPAYKQYLSPNGGSYNPRCIAGTGRISVHSYGIAFDINPAYGQYWQYGLKKGISEAQFATMPKPLVYRNKIPLEIVRVFEKHGFIWGGAWYHFDGMHFEYRPEFKALEAIMARS